MAKQISTIKLQGTFQEVTYVNSGAYGNHVRAPRGTYKPAPINASLEKEGKRVLMANVPAKILKDAIAPYRRESGGKLWQRLVSFFHKQLKVNGQFDITRLVPFDIHERYPLHGFFPVQSTITADKTKSKLRVALSCDTHPRFKKLKTADGYMLTAICIFPDLEKKTAHTITTSSPARKLTGPFSPLILELEIPSAAREYIVFLKLQSCENGVVSNAITTTALCAVGGGKI